MGQTGVADLEPLDRKHLDLSVSKHELRQGFQWVVRQVDIRIKIYTLDYKLFIEVLIWLYRIWFKNSVNNLQQELKLIILKTGIDDW